MLKIEDRRLSLLLVLIAPVLLFGSMLLRGEALYWGTPTLQFVPWHRFALEIFQQGQIPLWNPLLGMGAPLLANLQSALLYPPNLLLWIVGPELGHGYLVVLHMILAGVGMLLLARKLGLGAFGQLVAGLTFSLSGYMVARAWFISINHAAAWLPWMLLFAERIFDRMEERAPWKDSLPVVLGLTLALTMQWLAGHAQTAWYSLMMLAGWTLWRLGTSPDGRNLQWVLSRLLTAAILAFLLSAAQLLPTLEYLSISQRASSLDRELALTYSFWPWRFLGLIVPDLFGNPANGNYWGYGNYWEDAIYVGVLPLLLALGSLRRGLGKSIKGVSLERFLIINSVVVILLALGKNTPLFPFLFDHIPSFDLFQAPTRWNLLLMFCLALLAALGAERWSTPSGRGLYWTRLLTAGAGIIALASYLGLRLMPQVEPTFVSSFAVAGVLMTISGVLTLFLPKDHTVLKISVVGGFLIADLLIAGRGLNPSITPSVFEGNVLMESGMPLDRRIYMSLALEERLKFEETHRFDAFDSGVDWQSVRAVGLPNTSLLDGIASVNNFDPMLPGRYVTFLEALEELEPALQDRMLAWLGVAHRISAAPAGGLGVVLTPLATQGRVHLVAEARFVDTAEQALDQIVSGALDLEAQVVLEGEPSVQSWRGAAGTILAVREPGPHEIEISVEAPDGAWLVLADTWYPGWQASIDGSGVKIFRANYLFRAVAIPPGTHSIHFVYDPLSFFLGSVLSVIGLIGVTLLGIVCFRRK